MFFASKIALNLLPDSRLKFTKASLTFNCCTWVVPLYKVTCIPPSTPTSARPPGTARSKRILSPETPDCGKISSWYTEPLTPTPRVNRLKLLGSLSTALPALLTPQPIHKSPEIPLPCAFAAEQSTSASIASTTRVTWVAVET